MSRGLLMLFLFMTAMKAQSPVDLLVNQLDSLTTHSIADWRYLSEFEDETSLILAASSRDYNDAHWKKLSFNQLLYVDSCWLRSRVILPDKFLGQSIAGRVKLLLSVDDGGFLWLNGQDLGYFPWDGEFTLTEEARPGLEYIILIKAINTGGPLRLLNAEISFESLRPLVEEIRNLTLSIKVGQKLLGFDTYQTNARLKIDPGVDNSRIKAGEKKRLNKLFQAAAGRIDVQALQQGAYERFQESVTRILPDLQKVNQFAKQFTLFFSANAHIDAAWLWRKGETQEVCKNTFSSVIRMIRQNRDLTFTQSSAVFYKWMQELHPDLFQEIISAEKDGRWEIIGGTWIEPDCNLISGESWWRQLLIGQNYFGKNFGKRVKIGWNPDSFGYNWNMPQFYRSAGIDAFITQKISWNDSNVFPHRLFWWESPDGSRILSYFPFSYSAEVDDPFQLVDWLRQYEANTGFTKLMVLFGVGDHGGGPTPEMLQRIEKLSQLYIYPRVEYGTSTGYLNWVRSHDLKALPVWRDELYLEYHRGTFTTQAAVKKYNRELETLLITLEKFACMAGLYQSPYPFEDLTDAWEKLLFNQFHDILPGSSIREVYIDALEEYHTARELGEFHLRRSLKNLSDQINTSGLDQGKPVVVFNPLSWERSDHVSLELEKGDENRYSVYDAAGQQIPSQRIAIDKLQSEIIFQAQNVPPLGYCLFELRPGSSGGQSEDLQVYDNIMENRYFRVTIDSQTGWIGGIYDKLNKKEVLSGPGNELQLYKDTPRAWDAWNIGLSTRYPTKFRKIEILETGPVRAVIRVHHDFLNPKTVKNYPTPDFPTTFFMQDIILYRDIPRIDFQIHVDWWEDHTMLKVAFPVTVRANLATYDVPYATIQRPTRLEADKDKGKWEVPALRWADLSGKDYGVSLLNRSKYGYDIRENVIRLSLLRSPRWPDPTADRGKHIIDYSLYPHTGDWREAGLPAQGYSYNTPLMAVFTEKKTGTLPAQYSFIQIEPASVMITGIKQGEEKTNTWIVQVIETSGQSTRAVITLPFSPSTVYLSNFLEDEVLKLKPGNKSIPIELNSHEIKTLKICL